MFALITYFAFTCASGSVELLPSPIANTLVIATACPVNTELHCADVSMADGLYELTNCTPERVFVSGFDDATSPSSNAP